MSGPDTQPELEALFAEAASTLPTSVPPDDRWLRQRLRDRRNQRTQLAALAITGIVACSAVVALTTGQDAAVELSQPASTARPSADPSGLPSANDPSSPAPVAPTPSPLTIPTGARLLVVQGTRMDLLDVDTGTVTLLPTDPRLLEFERIDVVAVGEQLVMLGNNNTGAGNSPTDVYATTAGPGSPLRRIGRASQLYSSAVPGTLWLQTIEETSAGADTSMRLVEADGRVRQVVDHPDSFGVDPLGFSGLRTSVEEGLEGDVLLIDPDGDVARRYPRQSVLAASALSAILREATTCERAPCQLRVIAETNPAGRTLDVDPVVVQGSFGDLSRKGRWLLTTVQVGDGVGSFDRVSVTDLQNGGTTTIDEAAAGSFYGFDPAFSDDERWAFWPDADLRRIVALDLVSSQPYRAPGFFQRISSIVKITPSGGP